MIDYPFRPAQGWVFVEMDHDIYNHATLFDVGRDIDRCLVGRDAIVNPVKPIDLPLGGVAVRLCEIVILKEGES